MGDRATLEKAKKELEDLYLGVPDESVNLTFQDFAQVRQQHIPENKKLDKIPSLPLAKHPSIDFRKGLEASFQRPNNNAENLHPHHHRAEEARPGGHHHNHHGTSHHDGDHHVSAGDQRSMVYDDMSHVSGMSVAYGGGRRRPGIPHSNICTICCNYIYICRHRCLVCGRVYCRQCVSMGMGEMAEGRKCIDCLGRRFSQRYMHKAGNVGCCMGYSSVVKQQELKWAEKGARRSGENRYGGGNSVMMVSRSRSPVGLATPTRPLHSPANPPSFVMNSPTNHHPMPF